MDNRGDDPDVWTVLNLCISAVSMFAQLATLRLPNVFRVGSYRKLNPHSEGIIDHIRTEIEINIRNTESLMRIISRADNVSELSDSKFQFGGVNAYFGQVQFNQYRELVSKIALGSGNLSQWVLTLVQIDPELAGELSSEIKNEVGDIAREINSLYDGSFSTMDVLDSCLRNLRSFHVIIQRLDGFKN